MHGHAGRILKVDLGSGRTVSESVSSDLARAFLGGNGFVAKLVHDVVPARAAPLDTSNALVLAVGPLTDTPVWGTSRGHMGTISPQTGFFADSNHGGDFASALKRTRFDAVVITGRSPTPCCLVLEEDGGRLEAAEGLWGEDTETTLRELAERHGPDSVAACIGPAGENGVVFANIICGGKRTGAAGRAGMGAVMGSKNLKAVVARGRWRTPVARPEELRDYLRARFDGLREQTAALTTYGTPVLVQKINGQGMLCTRNNTRETFEHAYDISGELIKEKYAVRNSACRGCPVACGKFVRVPAGEFGGRDLKMPEYETLYAMGSMLDNRDIVSIFNGNGVCDLMGMDTISLGVTVAFVAECVERGIVSEAEAEVRFGDGERMVELAKLTARREGVGDLLAGGSARLASRFGRNSDRLLYCSRGLEMAGHSARGLRAMSLGYATSTRGGSHHDTRPSYPQEVGEDPGFDGQPDYNVRSQHLTAVGDSLVMCRFTVERGLGPDTAASVAELLRLVTGWDIGEEEVGTIGERIYNLERLVNVRRGLDRRCDLLPYRVINEPIPDGPARGRHCAAEDLRRMLDEYYRLRGWDEAGVPTAGTLDRLGLPCEPAVG